MTHRVTARRNGVQRIAMDGIGAAELASLHRREERAAFIIPTIHVNASEADRVIGIVGKVGAAMDGRFVVATEIPDMPSSRSLLSGLRDASRSEIRDFAASLPFSGYVMQLLLGYKELSASGVEIRPIGISRKDVPVEIRDEFEVSETVHFVGNSIGLAEMVPYILRLNTAVIKLGRLSNAIATERANSLIAGSSMPVVVEMGAGHLRHLEEEMRVARILSLVDRHIGSFIELNARAAQVATRERYEADDELAVAKLYLCNYALIRSPAGRELTDQIRSARSIAELEPVYSELRQPAL